MTEGNNRLYISGLFAAP